jgi:hypothetical protein
MPARRSTLDDSLAIGEWQRLRNLPLAGQAAELEPSTSAPLDDDLPMLDWQRVRNRQVGGSPQPSGGARPVRVSAMAAEAHARRPQPPTPDAARPRGPLRGRPGPAAVVADTLNTIASGPNTSAPVHTKGVDGVVRRGEGYDVSGEAKIAIPNVPYKPSVRAEGMLEPPTGRAEVIISKPRGHSILGAVELPERIRFFNTPSGELDVDLPSDVKIGPVTIQKRGRYAIGPAVPPGKK